MKHILKQAAVEMLMAYLCLYLIIFPGLGWAKPIKASTSRFTASSDLPVVYAEPGSDSGWTYSKNDSTHYLKVNQTDTRVVIKWKSFDIASYASVHFEQPSSGTALNQIYDSNPSQIFGQLTATGTIYLINQNGIIFGEGSRVNANSLVASALNIDISEEEFLDNDGNLWHFTIDNNYTDPGEVINAGTLTSDGSGRIFLMGNSVENSGTIDAEGGWIVLAASNDVEVETAVKYNNLYETLNTDCSGESVTNTSTGQILADTGKVGMYGKIVSHDGLIRTLSTVRDGTSVKLVASQKITTGSNSTIDAGIEELDEEVLIEATDFGNISLTSSDDDMPILIAHYGDITAPSGTVTMDAGDGGRIYMASGSTIDVSGSIVEDKSVEDLVMSAQLNSVELRDEEEQKDGILLGETVYFLTTEGVSIGNVSEHLESRVLSGADQSQAGGNISLAAGSGDIIIDEGASIDISGGYTVYNEGYVTTTRLIYDGVVYDISDAPDYLDYDQVVYDEDTYKEWMNTFSEGADAGSLILSAGQIAYEGSLNASVVQGLYQVNLTEDDTLDDLGYVSRLGTVIPTAGSLQIGVADTTALYYYDVDPVVYAITIMDETPGIQVNFDPETSSLSSSRNGETWISDDLLSNSGLGSVTLYAATGIVSEADTQISLAPGGSLTLESRRIYHQGDISVPAGTVKFTTSSNRTSDKYIYGTDDELNEYYVSEAVIGQERIELSDGSSISAAGEQIDNFTIVTTGDIDDYKTNALTDGGNITLRDNTNTGQGVVVRSGALLDVSGGYVIGVDKNLDDAGDGGSLTIVGAAIVLDGEVKGHAIVGQTGGSISLTAYNTDVVTRSAKSLSAGCSWEDSLPDNFLYSLVIDDNRLEDTGFTQIALGAYNNLTVHKNVTLEPSSTMMNVNDDGTIDLVDVDDDQMTYIGDSSISLVAGNSNALPEDFIGPETWTGNMTVEKGTNVTVGPGGSISVSGKTSDISGTFTAPAGTINISADVDLFIRSAAGFYAQGYNMKTDYLWTGDIVWETMDGGEILFESESQSGSLVMEEGAVVDVSGASAVTKYRIGDGDALEAYIAASQPGSVTLSFVNASDETGNSLINAEFYGNKALSTLQGGTFSIIHGNDGAIPDEYFALPASLITGIEDNGFDYLTLQSNYGIEFSTSQTITMDRGIVIDSPILAGNNDQTIRLDSSWIQLTNTYQPGAVEDNEGAATLAMNAEFIYITGEMKTSGFSNVYLTAEDDIVLEDFYYDAEAYNRYIGGLTVEENLTLTAARIYPTTASDFTISAGETVTILPSGTTRTDPIYSALGSVTVEAKNIAHYGVLTAPMGSILLSADTDEGRVYLAEGSVLSVAGEMSVNYGQIDEDNLLYYGEKTQASTEIDGSTINQTIEILGQEIIAADGSEINIEGGGSIYGYTFLSGTDGTYDLLDASNLYVILPYTMADLPGEAIFLEENDLVDEGVYVLLPISYAFIEGALIVEYQGDLEPDTVVAYSLEGYVEAVGYMGDAGTGTYSTDAGVYTIREASEVISQIADSYETVNVAAGNAGTLTVYATETNILNGTILAEAASSEYSGGVMNLIGKDVIIGSYSVDLGGGFNFTTQLEDDDNLSDLIGTLYLNADQISEAGLLELNIGVEEEDLSDNLVSALDDAGVESDDGVYSTDTITLENNAGLYGQSISLIAKEKISLGKGAAITASGDNAVVDLLATDGAVILKENSYISSEVDISIDADSFDREGEILAQGTLYLSSDYLYLADQAHEDSVSQGMVVDEAFWTTISETTGSVSLTGRQEIGFLGDIDLQVADIIAIDSPLIAGASGDLASVSLAADTIYLYNSSDPADTQTIETYHDNTQTLTVNGENIYIGYGVVQTSGFSRVNLNAVDYLTFVGSYENEDLDIEQGGFSTNDADLNMTAAMVTGAYRYYTGENDEAVYEAVDFKIDSGSGSLSIASNGNSVENNANIGGSLEFTADSIQISGTVSLSSGYLSFTSTGIDEGDGIFLENGALVSATGSRVDYVDDEGDTGVVYYDGGTVVYEAEGSGTVSLAKGSVTDVSADDTGGDAGTIAISVPEGDLLMAGSLKGQAAAGDGGSFILDTRVLADASELVDLLTLGGFDQEVDMRVREGDVSLAADVETYHFRLSADEGSVDIDGIIDASDDAGGGLIEIYAGANLTLSGDTALLAMGTSDEADGGEIILGNATEDANENNEYMTLGGSTLDVSGGDSATGGTVYIRVARNASNDGVNLDCDAYFYGASTITVEGTWFDEESSITISGDLKTTKNAYKKALEFMAYDETGTFVENELLQSAKGDLDGFTLIAGIEFWNDGSLTWKYSQDMDFSSWRFGADNTPIALTLRAEKNLIIQSDIVDAPTYTEAYDSGSIMDLSSDTAQSSTRITLVAGATLSSADPFAVEEDAGDLTLGYYKSGKLKRSIMIYTESGDINFASGGDTTIGSVKTSTTTEDYMTTFGMQYSLASYTGTIRGQTLGDLILDGGVIQTATGDINLDVGRDLLLVNQKGTGSEYYLGSIRTIGELMEIDSDSVYSQSLYSEEEWMYWKQLLTAYYTEGGSITINAGGDVLTCDASGTADLEAVYSAVWDDNALIVDLESEAAFEGLSEGWSAAYGSSIDIDVNGFEMDDLNDGTTQGIATLGGGDVTIISGGDVLAAAGTFGTGGMGVDENDEVSGTGDLTIKANGDINGRYLNYYGTLDLTAMGSYGTLSDGQIIEAFDSQISLVAQGGITLCSVVNPTITSAGFRSSSDWNLTYAQDSSVSMTSAIGSISLTGIPDEGLGSGAADTNVRFRVLPGSLYLNAAEDIILGSDFYMAPYAYGSLEMYAGGDITSSDDVIYAIIMSDADPDDIYGEHDYKVKISEEKTVTMISYMSDEDEHGTSILHESDYDPVIIQAGNNIENISFVLPKSVTLTANNDITDIVLIAQNVHDTDLTLVQAGNNITFETEKGGSTSSLGITVGGTGLTIVQAGNDIDLGSSEGISLVGSTNNSLLKEGDNDLMVVAGTESVFTLEEINALFWGDEVFLTLVEISNAPMFLSNGSLATDGAFTLAEKIDAYTEFLDGVADIDAYFEALRDEINAMTDGDLKDAMESAYALKWQIYQDADLGAGIESLIDSENFNLTALQADIRAYGAEDDFVAGIDGLVQAGTKYTQAQSDGDDEFSQEIVESIRLYLQDQIDCLVYKLNSDGELESDYTSSGNISLINSKIYTTAGSGTIYAFATGSVDVGVSSVDLPGVEDDSDDSSGIYTTSGGGINIFAGGDINVNQSRVMSFDGGDIVLWSDYGNINAGMGSKVAVANPDPYYIDNGDGTYTKVYQVPAVGSGVRATATSLLNTGDIYAFAPNGIIDASEAGIAGRNVTLGAEDVLNSENIEVMGLAIGFTKPSESSASVTGVSGSGGLADAGMMNDEASSALAGAQDRMGDETPEGYSYEPRWVDVEVVGFEEDKDQEKG